MDKDSEDLKWTVNIETLHAKFNEIPFFDETLRFNKTTAYHLVGEESN